MQQWGWLLPSRQVTHGHSLRWLDAPALARQASTVLVDDGLQVIQRLHDIVMIAFTALYAAQGAIQCPRCLAHTTGCVLRGGIRQRRRRFGRHWRTESQPVRRLSFVCTQRSAKIAESAGALDPAPRRAGAGWRPTAARDVQAQSCGPR